jgi:hypothetical protein
MCGAKLSRFCIRHRCNESTLACKNASKIRLEDDTESEVLSALTEEIVLEQSDRRLAKLITPAAPDIASVQPVEIEVTMALPSRSNSAQQLFR